MRKVFPFIIFLCFALVLLPGLFAHRVARSPTVIPGGGGGGIVDISAETNLTTTEPVELTGDDLGFTIYFDVTRYGATGDGATDDRTAVNNAGQAATLTGGAVLFPNSTGSGTYRISSDITFNSDVTLVFDAGANLFIDAGDTVTIDGRIAPTLHQIFSGSGSVSLSAGSCEYALPQWWGAVGDDATDCHAAIELAITAAVNVGKVYLPAGTYQITASLDNFPYDYKTSYKGIVLEGAGRGKAIIKYTGTSGFAIQYEHPDQASDLTSKTVNNQTLRDLHIKAPNLDNSAGLNTYEGGGILFTSGSWNLVENVSMDDIGDGSTAGTDVLIRRRHYVQTEDSYTEDTNRDFGTTGGGSNEKYAFLLRTDAFSSTQRLKQVTCLLGITGTPAGTVEAVLYTDNTGPDAVVYGSHHPALMTDNPSNAITINTISSAAAGEEITFIWDGEDAPLISGNTIYWVVLQTTGYTYANGVTELRLRVDAGDGIASWFGDYDVGWNLTSDGVDFVLTIGIGTPEVTTLRNVYSKDGSTRSLYGMELQDDAHLMAQTCVFQNESSVVRVLGTANFRSIFSLYDTDGNFPAIDVASPEARCLMIGDYIEGANQSDYPSSFVRSTKPSVFVGTHMTVMTSEAGADVRDFGSDIGRNVNVNNRMKPLDLKMVEIIHPDDSRISNVVTGYSVANDAPALYGRAIQLDANNEGVRYNFRSRTTAENFYILLAKGTYLITVVAKDTNQVASDFTIQSASLIGGANNVLASNTFTLTAAYETYYMLHILDDNIADVNFKEGSYVRLFKDTAGANTISISHIKIERVGGDKLDIGDTVSWNPDASDADGARESKHVFVGRQSGLEQSALVTTIVSHDGAADDEKGKYEIGINDGDDGFAPTIQATYDSNGLALAAGADVNEFSTDGTLAGDSDDAVPTEKATKTYVDGAVAGAGKVVYVEEGDVAKVNSSANDLYIDFDATDFSVGVVGNEGNITVTDDGHAHTSSSLSGIDISADTNLTASAPVTLTGDDIGLTVAKDIVATGTGMSGGEDNVLPGADADTTITLTTNKDIVAGIGLSGGEDDVLPGADADTTINIDTTWDATFNSMTLTTALQGITLNDQFSYMLAGQVLQNATTPPLILAWITPATTEVDLSGNGNDATYNNFVTGDQVYKGLVWGLNFYDGNDEYLNVGDDAAFSWDDTGANPWSVCAWIEVVNTANTQAVISKWDVQSTDREWTVQIDSNEKIKIFFFDEADDKQCKNQVDDALSVGWRFICHTYDSTGGASAMSDANSVWYVDGVAVAEGQVNDADYTGMVAGATDVTIGSYDAGAGQANFFQGDMGIIWIEDVELSAAQVWSMYISQRGFYNE